MNAKQRQFNFRAYALVGSIFILALVLSACARGATPKDVVEDCKKNPDLVIAIGENSQIACKDVLAQLGIVAITQVVNATEAPAEPTALGLTNCAEAEKVTTGTGTVADPLIYPDGYAHDLCWASAGNGTGAKYIRVRGPAALQMGEFTGPARMVYVPSGTTFTGWTQGGWAYVSDEALLAQWKVEDLNVGRLGLICGYIKNTRLWAPAFRWDGNKEVRDTTLDCPYTVQQLLSGNYGGVSVTPAPASANVTEIFKIEVNGSFYCGARLEGAVYPAGYRHIETYPAENSWLTNVGDNSLTTSGFCKGQPVRADGQPASQTAWKTALVDASGLHETQFPMP